LTRRFHIGTSGWVYLHWRDVFYPRDLPQPSWFAHYAERFSTVEINSTFYRLAAEKTWKAWRDQAPAGFCYAVKGSRYVTHMRRLKDCDDAVRTFVERAHFLGEHLGPVLWQLPPNLRYDPRGSSPSWPSFPHHHDTSSKCGTGVGFGWRPSELFVGTTSPSVPTTWSTAGLPS
jgi:uncharacterized protein YecE (DUF72 family)